MVFGMDNHALPANKHIQRCPRCATPLQTIVVHGHKVCASRKPDIIQCCTGDTCVTDQNLAVGYKST